MSRNLTEAIQYFRGKKGFKALFLQFRKKYESLGRIGGNADLSSFTQEELEEIALFMGISPHHLSRKKSLSLQGFEKHLEKTKFTGITLHDLLEAYFRERIQAKKFRKLELLATQEEKIRVWKDRFPAIADWFGHLEKKTADGNWIRRLILEDSFDEEVKLLAKGFSYLPDKLERYPLFSQRVSGNPHALDLSTQTGKLWIHLLHILSGGEGKLPGQTEAINELLLSYNLLRDDISNFVTTANLIGYTAEGPHPVWKNALTSNSVLNVPLRELLKLEKVIAPEPAKAVFIVENSGVFSAIIDEVPSAPLICTHGQFKLAGLRLMDFLADSGHTLYYSGDFDPEGLTMALRFKNRYLEKGQLWRMSAEDYEASTPSAVLGEREGKLSALHGTILENLAEIIRKNKKMGYQEGILTLMIEDILAGQLSE
ncbi:TIGR02679 family protein [Cytobacillus firmus]|uniref:Uncharacterized protein n=1 Tax=Cytobacillus firmus TaxID=1399 RepID=A0A380XDV1_CYTFI|nr:TIGR02679 family protein [Cytobacillus firmus]KAF0824186.1 hypothetical protein KIS1582_2001 [Cytobacillus firmus]MBG9544931.1 hypothetical protein [Cytobacillus firmus]MBG9550345.1 hypothetical protein [Cytobacillus firmus]MBG9554236.1 hypothetical protein [Cytobacillus firmus]MBG9557097.1 hypothetical protein [Cytobacillus firmus]